MIEKLKKVYQKYKGIVWVNGTDDNPIANYKNKESIMEIVFVSGIYLFLYFFFYVVKFSTYQKYNEKLILELKAKNSNAILFFLNTYPGNVIYIIVTIVIFAIAMVLSTYMLTLILETDKRKFSDHSAISLRSTATAFSVFPIVLIINSLFPVSELNSKFLTAFLVSSWIILAIASFVISARSYVIVNAMVYGQPKRRSLIIWGIPFYFVLDFMFGVIFN